ncbi:MAG: hypothetical protein Q9N32_00370 [Gammaproteobacteria bacterium]|nr:hypothetical protein [Gammaproteobacteria bacterium]
MDFVTSSTAYGICRCLYLSIVSAEIFREHAALSGFENNGRRDFDISGLATLSDQQYDDLKPVQWPVTKDSPNGTPRMFEDKRSYAFC